MAQAETEQNAQSVQAALKQAGPSAVLNDEIEIFPGQPMPDFDQGPIKAYAAKSRRGVSAFALVCERSVIPRTISTAKYVGVLSTTIFKLIGSGVLFWPPESRQKYVFVYELVASKKLMPTLSHVKPMRQEVVLSSIVRPLANLLQDFRDSDFVHSAINPTNIYVNGDQKIDRVILGDCLSVPYGYIQDPLFLSPQYGLAEPSARGLMTHADDLYAFGVTIAMLLRAGELAPLLTGPEITRQKLEYGSYVAITGRDRFTGSILELLRGLIQDDVKARWTIDEVLAWLDGKRLSPKQTGRQLKGTRPLILGEDKYLIPSHLAMDIPDKPSEAVKAIESDDLKQWASRSIGDAHMEERISYAISSAQEMGQGPGYVDRLVSRAAIAVFPSLPISFGRLRIMPEGFGTALSEAMVLGSDLKPFVEIIQQGLVPFWLNMQIDSGFDYGSIIGKFDLSALFLKQVSVGYGLERCVYFLSPETPCLSEKLKKYHVRNPEDLVRAFEDMASKNDRSNGFLDRHIIAFLSIKDRKLIEVFMPDLNSGEPHRVIMATLNVLSSIQSRARLESLPNLTQWIHDLIPPVYERYHDRDLRTKIKEKVDRVKSSGSISSIVSVLENQQIVQSDKQGYKNSQIEFYNLRLEEISLEQALAQGDGYGRQTGREVAAIIAGLICAFVVIGLMFAFIINGSVF